MARKKVDFAGKWAYPLIAGIVVIVLFIAVLWLGDF